MKAKDIIADAITAYKLGECVSVVCNYKKAVKILKALISLPETTICSIEIHDAEWDGYGESWLITLCENGEIYCQKAINDRDGNPFRGDGYYIIEEKALNNRRPQDFCFGGAKVRVV